MWNENIEKEDEIHVNFTSVRPNAFDIKRKKKYVRVNRYY